MIVIAHRGASAFAPEHTLPAYDLGLAMRADYIEQDLQMTADGVLVVMHDDTIERTLRCKGAARSRDVTRVREMAWDELRECDAGSWFNERFPGRARADFVGLGVPTLDDVLARYADRANFYIETKAPEGAASMEEKLVALLRHHGLVAGAAWDATTGDALARWSPPPRVVIQSFSAASLRTVRTLAPALPLVQLLEANETSDTILTRLERIAEYAAGIGPHHAVVDERVVGAAHGRGVVVHPYTVNEESEMRRLHSIGVDGVFTDTPGRLRALLDSVV